MEKAKAKDLMRRKQRIQNASSRQSLTGSAPASPNAERPPEPEPEEASSSSSPGAPLLEKGESNVSVRSEMDKELEALGILPVCDSGATGEAVEAPQAFVVADESSLEERRRCYYNPTQDTGLVLCYVKRDRSGMNRLHPRYEMYTKEGVFLMAAKLKGGGSKAMYSIAVDRVVTPESFLGKLRANFSGTHFTIFDDGVSAKKRTNTTERPRREHGAVLYETNIMGSKGPRKLQALLPTVIQREGSGGYARAEFSEEEDIIDKFKKGTTNMMVHLKNKPPRFNHQLGAYVLNFNGRVTMASVKNFQLVEDGKQDKLLLQFGRVGKDQFNLDFRFPLSPYQAFCIALTALDHKLACE
eukprot:TRINITY_DN38814_c0_g1_i1.p1 TRINITY_DN38814_c0_g1~~TRINITY_DN38814_c0_g1_i1.p1  ORF type:complete len:381 (+),score=82.50 TRINITY_DN38814_c0_g1_i1:77-1144(+)